MPTKQTGSTNLAIQNEDPPWCSPEKSGDHGRN